VGVILYVLTDQNEFYKIDTRDRSCVKEDSEDSQCISGFGLDFCLKVRDSNVFSKGGNKYGQLGCGHIEPSETEEFVQGISYPVRSAYAGGASCFAVVY